MPPENVSYPASRRERNYVKKVLQKCYNPPPKASEIKESKTWKNGYRRFYLTDKEHYRGCWKDNMRHGVGKLYNMKTGETYEGYLFDDVYSGYGIISKRKPNGLKDLAYVGEFANGAPNGKGELHTDTYQYKGKIINGKPSGVGAAWYNDGTIYFGTWFDGKRMGEGILIHRNMNRYEGNWYNDKRHGYGQYCFFNRGQALEGIWIADVCKRGIIRNIKYRQAATDPVKYAIPQLMLKDWASTYFLWEQEALASVGKYIREDLGIPDLEKKERQSPKTSRISQYEEEQELENYFTFEIDLRDPTIRYKFHPCITRIQPCVVLNNKNN